MRAVVVRAPVARAIPAGTTAAIALATADGVILRVQRRAPGEHVCLLEVDLRALFATHGVRIAVVVRALRRLTVVPHAGQQDPSVAPTASSGKVACIPHGLPAQVNSEVVLRNVFADRAGACEVGAGAKVRRDRLACNDLHLRSTVGLHPPRWHHRNRAVPLQVDAARARGAHGCSRLVTNGSSRLLVKGSTNGADGAGEGLPRRLRLRGARERDPLRGQRHVPRLRWLLLSLLTGGEQLVAPGGAARAPRGQGVNRVLRRRQRFNHPIITRPGERMVRGRTA
mmetsp:Transcript_78297/g.201603  ORF Transcript_78297/g.201603 Transcript_78297/m.201603 type:complete len:283 (-) Transcript_78297:986-1834(-)